MNGSHASKVEEHFSFHTSRKERGNARPNNYVELHGYCVRAYPPTGDGIRNTYDEACSNS